MLTPLCEIARRHGVDWGGVMEPYPNHRANLYHEYSPIFYDLTKDWASEAWAVLEIGVAEGRSLRTWAEWFPNAQIDGFDVDEKSLLIKENRIRTYYADQSNETSLIHAWAVAGAKDYDYIIDDGSHVREHQALTFNVLSQHLKPHGIYFIEDRIDNAEPIPALGFWSNHVIRWPDKPHSMLQIIRKTP
jgi:hypothetical protein